MTVPYYADDAVTLHHGDCLDVLRTLPDASVDAVVTDPPYDLTAGKKGGTGQASVNLDSPYGRSRISTGNGGFMGKDWDATGIAFDPDTWREVLRVLKPGGYLLTFGGSRTWHRLAVAVEDAGFEIRDSIAWLYGSGFPKSLDVSKAIDKAVGAEREIIGTEPDRWTGKGGVLNFATDRPQAQIPVTGAPATEAAQQWQGWGTALKPAFEPIVVGRKPLIGTVAANILEHGTGALNIDGCRTATADDTGRTRTTALGVMNDDGWQPKAQESQSHTAGRWPTNVVLDESQAAALDKQTGVLTSGSRTAGTYGLMGYMGADAAPMPAVNGDSGGASRFFPTFRYEAKAPTSERPAYWAHDCDCEHDVPMRPGGSCLTCGTSGTKVAHPTVKPLDLMRWLVRLVTPPGGTVLEPFTGSGTTAEACVIEGFRCIAIEREADYLPLIVARLTKPIQIGLDFGGAA